MRLIRSFSVKPHKKQLSFLMCALSPSEQAAHMRIKPAAASHEAPRQCCGGIVCLILTLPPRRCSAWMWEEQRSSPASSAQTAQCSARAARQWIAPTRSRRFLPSGARWRNFSPRRARTRAFQQWALALWAGATRKTAYGCARTISPYRSPSPLRKKWRAASAFLRFWTTTSSVPRRQNDTSALAGATAILCSSTPVQGCQRAP